MLDMQNSAGTNAGTNPFASADAAALYARGRIGYPSSLMERIRATLDLREPVAFAVDVGCGTGLSTVALSSLAVEVLGIDTSAEMVARALTSPHVSYAVAAAEALPVADNRCDLVTVASAFPWFRRDAFLAEAYRVLRPSGWLLLYDLAFTGAVAGAPRLTSWIRQDYLRTYPFPARNREPIGADTFASAGFAFQHEEHYTTTVRLARPELAAFLASQANTLAALERGHVTAESLMAGLNAGLARAMGRRREVACEFRGAIRYVRRLP